MPKIRLDEIKAALEQRRTPAEASEADYKRKLVAEINRLPGGYARRIEDRFAVGVLDLLIKYPEVEVIMAEGKLIEGNLFAPTERQYEEGLRLNRAEIEPFLIGWKQGVMYVSPWVKQADYRDCFTIRDVSHGEVLWRFLTAT
jgi:hypothetical protein